MILVQNKANSIGRKVERRELVCFYNLRSTYMIFSFFKTESREIRRKKQRGKKPTGIFEWWEMRENRVNYVCSFLTLIFLTGLVMVRPRMHKHLNTERCKKLIK